MPRFAPLWIVAVAAACTPHPEGWGGGECQDGLDNDANGAIDCADDACASNLDCQLQADPDSDVDTEQDVGTDADTEPDTEADTEPDTEANPRDPIPRALQESPDSYNPACDDNHGVVEPGALVWNLGRLTFTGAQIRGYAVWGMRANPAWAAGPGYDCQLTWSVTGTRGTPSNCADCEYSLPLQLQMVASESTCDPDLIADLAGARSVTYNVQVNGADVELFFPATGNRFAGGTASTTRMDYRSPPGCIFF